MVKGSAAGWKDHNMMVIGDTIWLMAKELLNLPMVENTPVSGKIIRDMGMDFTRMSMAPYIRGIWNMMRNMVMEF